MIREGRVEDLPEITRVRTSVIENHLSVEGMAARSITHETTSAKMRSGRLGTWVAEVDSRIVAFAMADRETASLWALFTEPGFEGRGFGSALLAAAEGWLAAAARRKFGLTLAAPPRRAPSIAAAAGRR